MNNQPFVWIFIGTIVMTLKISNASLIGSLRTTFSYFHEWRMLYPADFSYLKPRSNLLRLRRLVKGTTVCKKRYGNLESFWEEYCLQTSVHGVKYMVEKETHKFERIIWAILVALALLGTIYVCIMLSTRYNNSPLETVVESTIYPVYEISFPAVTVCNYNRYDFRRLNDSIAKFLPNATTEMLEVFNDFIQKFENFEFGSFDVFSEMTKENLTLIDSVNVTEFLMSLVHPCEDIFRTYCWWRNKIIKCCEHFLLHKTEYGLCYSFNSAFNDLNNSKMNDPGYPWRTSGFGDWSGLKVNVYINPKAKHPKSKWIEGLYLSVHNPAEWPTAAYFIPVGTSTSVNVKAQYSKAMPGTKRISPQRRQCVFKEEAEDDSKYMRLPESIYLRRNCVAECRRQYIMQYCNCTPDFFFPLGHFTPCTPSDFYCLSEHDSLFNYEKPEHESVFFSSEEEGMICPCLFECLQIEYKIETSTINIKKDKPVNAVYLDVHFQEPTLVKYRTDVVFGWLDLMVSFGGIAGLFLGSSLLSFVELIYYLTIGLGIHLKEKLNKQYALKVASGSLKTKKISVKPNNQLLSPDSFTPNKMLRAH